LYDEEDRPDHVALDGVVENRLIECFQLHGAVSMDPLLLMPAKQKDIDDSKTATFLDRQGELVALPKHLIQSFARLAARLGIERIKRFHIGNTYRPSPSGGHPNILKVAVFDIITSDPTVSVSEAEAIALVSEIVDIFPGLNSATYDIHVSHNKSLLLSALHSNLQEAKCFLVCEVALAKLPEDQKRNIISILDNTKTAVPLKRSLLTKLGLARATLDDLDALLQIGRYHISII
jgi:eukaryotic translation initiation factor 2-alpha kinase 4